MNRLQISLATVTLAVLAGMAPQAANATLTMRLDDLGTAGIDVVVVDGGVGDFNAMAGAITYIGGAGGWTLNVSTALGTSLLTNFGMDLNSVNLGTGNLRISFSETDIMANASGPTALASAIGGVTAGSLAYALYADDANTMFGNSNLVFSGAGTGAFSSSGGGVVGLNDPFSLTMQVDITHKNMGATSFNFESKVPEPSALALVGIAMLGLGLTTRRRQA